MNRLECDPELLTAELVEQAVQDMSEKDVNYLLQQYNASSDAFKAGVDAALTCLTGWTMKSLVARAKGEEV